MVVKKYTKDNEFIDGDLGLSWVDKWLIDRQPFVWALDPFTGNYYKIQAYRGKNYITDELPTNKVWGNVYNC